MLSILLNKFGSLSSFLTSSFVHLKKNLDITLKKLTTNHFSTATKKNKLKLNIVYLKGINSGLVNLNLSRFLLFVNYTIRFKLKIVKLLFKNTKLLVLKKEYFNSFC